MTAQTARIARMTLSARESEIRAQVTSQPASWLTLIGLGTPEALEAHIAAKVADEAEVLGL